MHGQRFGKPQDLAEAVQMIQRLSGGTHSVITALWATDGTRWRSAYHRTEVHVATNLL